MRRRQTPQENRIRKATIPQRPLLRIDLSHEEILADLRYPAPGPAAARRRGGGR